MYPVTNFYYFILSKFLGGGEAAALMDEQEITRNMRMQKERPVNTVVMNRSIYLYTMMYQSNITKLYYV